MNKNRITSLLASKQLQCCATKGINYEGVALAASSWLSADQGKFELEFGREVSQSRFYLNATLARALRGSLSDLPTQHELLEKPIVLSLALPLPRRLRFYVFTATQHSSERQMGTYKIQLTAGVPSHIPDRYTFDRTDTIRPIVVGYIRDLRLFVLWDAELHDLGDGYPFSKSLQVPPEVIWNAVATGQSGGTRQLRVPSAVETIIAARPERLKDAMVRRISQSNRTLLSMGG